MKRVLFAAVASLFVAGTAFAAPAKTTAYDGHCAWGLTMGKAVKTDCKINWTDSATNTQYCFSTEEAKANWAKDTAGNAKKATAEFAKVGGDHGHDHDHDHGSAKTM